MQSWKTIIVVSLLASVLTLSAGAQNRTYLAFDTNVPFSFQIGDRKFHAGDYQFVVTGAGLMAMRDGKGNTLTTLLTRDVRAAEPTGPTRLVFEKLHGRTRLLCIWMNNSVQGFEILKEEVVASPLQPSPPELILNMPTNALRQPHK